MKKIRLLALLVVTLTVSIYSQSILLIRPNGTKYKKMEIGLKSSVNNKAVNTIVFKNESEIVGAIQSSAPKLVVVMGADQIKAWRKIQQSDTAISQIPSVLIENEFSGINVGDSKNSCIVSYEPKLKNYVSNFEKLTGNVPHNIGLVYSSRSQGLQKTFQKDCAKLNYNLHAKSVVVSELENSIKTIIDNFVKHYDTDLIIVLDDHVVINDKNLSSVWVPALSSVKKQVAVPSDFFYELEPKIGTFAIQPHFSEIGQTVASVINEIEINNWKLMRKSVYVDKSVFYSRNKDGAISKENQIKNKVIVSFFPETEGVQTAMNSQQSNSDGAAVKTTDVPTTVREEKPKVELKPESNVVSVVLEAKKPQAEVAIAETKSVKPESSVNADSKQSVPEQTKKFDDTNKQAALQKSDDKVVVEEMVQPEVLAENNGYEIVVTSQTTSIYKDLAPEFHVLGIGRGGDVLKVLSEDSLWYCVDFFGTQGFLAKESACSLSQKRDMAEHTTDDNQTAVIFVVTILVVIVLILLLFMLTIRSVKRTKRKTNCLMIRRKPLWIKYSGKNDKQVVFAKYLKNFGFRVKVVKSIDQISIFSPKNRPRIVFVDWQMEHGIHEKINEMLKEQIFAEDCMVVFYNIADAADIGTEIPFDSRTFFLSKKFTVLDLNKILLLVKMDSGEKNGRTSGLLDSSLNGVITEQSLQEIIHMMDVNKKTGCLLVKDQCPIGMIFFEDGLMTYAMTNTKIAEHAVFEILSLKSGSFQFVPGRKPTSRQMQLDVMSALMENAKAEDESFGDQSILIG